MTHLSYGVILSGYLLVNGGMSETAVKNLKRELY